VAIKNPFYLQGGRGAINHTPIGRFGYQARRPRSLYPPQGVENEAAPGGATVKGRAYATP